MDLIERLKSLQRDAAEAYRQTGRPLFLWMAYGLLALSLALENEDWACANSMVTVGEAFSTARLTKKEVD